MKDYMEVVIKPKNYECNANKTFESKTLISSIFQGYIVNKLRRRMSELQGSLHTPLIYLFAFSFILFKISETPTSYCVKSFILVFLIHN